MLGSMHSTNDLWGDVLVDLAFDLQTWALRCTVDVPDSGGARRYELVLSDVASFDLIREVPLPWNYAEFTEIWVEGERGDYRVEVVLWSEPSGFKARCSSVAVNRIT